MGVVFHSFLSCFPILEPQVCRSFPQGTAAMLTWTWKTCVTPEAGRTMATHRQKRTQLTPGAIHLRKVVLFTSDQRQVLLGVCQAHAGTVDLTGKGEHLRGFAKASRDAETTRELPLSYLDESPLDVKEVVSILCDVCARLDFLAGAEQFTFRT